MYFRQLRYFVKVAELGSFTAAAQALHVSQPALGMQIKKLEEEFGVSLLQRHSRGVQTTPAGAKLLERGQDILHQVELARQAMREFGAGRSGTFRLGVTPAVGRALAVSLLERCTDLFPGIEVQIVQGFSNHLASLMMEGKLDFAFTQKRLSDSTWTAIPQFIEEPHVFGKAKTLGRSQRPMGFTGFARLPLALDKRGAYTRDNLNRIAREWNVSLADVVEVDSTNILRDLVTGGHRCSITPFALFANELREGRLHVRRIDEPRLSREVYLNCRRDEQASELEREIRALLCDLVQERLRAGDFRWSPASEQAGEQTAEQTGEQAGRRAGKLTEAV